MNTKFDLILFDAANTLIHKPSLWLNMDKVLRKFNHVIDVVNFKKNHKLLSELIEFPDQTSSEFYKKFNHDLLLSIGIIPSEIILEELFNCCTYLPWEPFPDTDIIKTFNVKKGILSNFNSSLNDKIENLLEGTEFDFVIGSEEIGLRKPDLRFYKKAVEIMNIDPSRVLYIGDSLKLDIIPAKSIGFETRLIDRDGIYPLFEERIESLHMLTL